MIRFCPKALVLALALGLAPGGAMAQGAAPAATLTPAATRPLPKIETHAVPGYRLYRPGYRLSGKGALVTAQLCRIPGWAGQGPTRLVIERVDPDGAIAERHVVTLSRLGMRAYNNCTSVATRLEKVPDYGEKVEICARSGKATCK